MKSILKTTFFIVTTIILTWLILGVVLARIALCERPDKPAFALCG